MTWPSVSLRTKAHGQIISLAPLSLTLKTFSDPRILTNLDKRQRHNGRKYYVRKIQNIQVTIRRKTCQDLEKLLAHHDQVIDDQEFFLLFNLNTSKNPDFNWTYGHFDFDSLPNADCVAEIRFEKNDIPT